MLAFCHELFQTGPPPCIPLSHHISSGHRGQGQRVTSQRISEIRSKALKSTEANFRANETPAAHLHVQEKGLYIKS